MPAQIIFLHGPSSSGKSTLAKALLARLDTPYWYISIDHFRDAGIWQMQPFQTRRFNWSQSRAPFHHMLAAAAGQGNNLLVEHILDTDGWADDLRDLLAPYDVLFVGLHCSLATLDAREQARGDRPAGSAEKDFHSIHQGRVYDLELSGEDPAGKNAEQVIAALNSGIRTSEFAQTP